MEKRWLIPEVQREKRQQLVKQFGISPLVAQVLVNRGLEGAAAEEFLHPDLTKLVPPERIPGMPEAVRRLIVALQQEEKVLVYGDYDVDGITGTAVLVSALERLGIDAHYYIPDRMEEGYGLHEQAVEWAGQQGISLIVTVDCGINAVTEVAAAKRLGIDVIITDHHEPPEQLPDAAAVVNPKLGEDTGCRDLAGVGVAFKLVQAAAAAVGADTGEMLDVWQYLDLVTLGTVADMVPLLGDNRILVKYGLEKMPYTDRPGLQALMEVSGLAGREIEAGHIGFTLAPRLNAIGRLGNASLGVELLTTGSRQRGEELAGIMDGENRERQSIERDIFDEVMARVEREVDFNKERVVVMGSPLWHPGVIGIVASKIVERIHRPVVLLALAGDTGRASARSIAGFNMYQALARCRHLLERFGGHSMAAGCSCPAENIDRLRECLNRLAWEQLDEEQLVPALAVDCEVLLAQIDERLIDQLALLKPHGLGNPGPLFCCRSVNLIDWKQVGKEGLHAKLTFAAGNVRVDGIGFNMQAGDTAAAGGAVDVAFVPERNYWGGTVTVQLKVRDMKAISEPAVYTPCAGADTTAAGEQVAALVDGGNGAILAAGRLVQQDWLACRAAAAAAAGGPVVVVTPLASHCRQLVQAAEVFAGPGDFRLWEEAGDSTALTKGRVFFMSVEAFAQFRSCFPNDTSVVLHNLKREELGLAAKKCYIIGAVEEYKEHQVQLSLPDSGRLTPKKVSGGQVGRLFADGHPGVIFVSLPGQARRLAEQLSGEVPGGVTTYSDRLSYRQKAQVLHALDKGMVQVIISTHGLPLTVDSPLRVVAFDPPFNCWDYRGMHPLSGDLFLASDRWSWQRQEQLLKQIFLTRETMLAVYNVLKARAPQGALTANQVAASLGKDKPIHPVLLNKALAALSELGLAAAEGSRWRLLPAAGKKDVHSSWHYREGEAEIKALAQCRLLLEQELEQATNI